MDDIEKIYGEAVGTKNEIVSSNLRLVVSIAKRHVGPTENFFELVSDGNMSLIRAVEKFDFARGNKFSTYASWAIMKNFARTIPGEFKQRDRFRPTSEEVFLARADQRTDSPREAAAGLSKFLRGVHCHPEMDANSQIICIYAYPSCNIYFKISYCIDSPYRHVEHLYIMRFLAWAGE